MNKSTLITWGRHPAHGAQWIKLHRYSAKKNAERMRQGWALAFVAAGQPVPEDTLLGVLNY